MAGTTKFPVTRMTLILDFEKLPDVDPVEVFGRAPSRAQVAGDLVNPKRPGGAIHRRTAWFFESPLEEVSLEEHFAQVKDVLDVLGNGVLEEASVDLRLMMIAAGTGNMEFFGPELLRALAKCDATLSIDAYDGS